MCYKGLHGPAWFVGLSGLSVLLRLMVLIGLLGPMELMEFSSVIGLMVRMGLMVFLVSYVDNGVVWSMGPMGFKECTLMRNLGLVGFFAVAVRVFWLDFLRNVKSTVISAENLLVFDSRSPSVSSTTAVMPTCIRCSRVEQTPQDRYNFGDQKYL